MKIASTFSPVRIYVLWHPGLDGRDSVDERDLRSLSSEGSAHLDRGLKLARRIYYWFRLENMEGIPVYFRSAPAKGHAVRPRPIFDDAGVRNYVIPLIDAHMVSSPDWRDYVSTYARRCDEVLEADEGVKRRKKSEFRVLPVALEPVAYNMPGSMRRLNFIRHIIAPGEEQDDALLIARLTEVLCRDLRAWLHSEVGSKGRKSRATQTGPDKLKIFLSHAKADDTLEAIALKEYIQRETQCEAFFDETDIASGWDYTRVLESAITRESAGLIVIQGDNYADRPWCRKEIRDFLKPMRDPLVEGTERRQFFIPPAVVVQTMKGKQIARTIPELGHSPCVRWQDGAARFVVTTLLREILFGLFYRVLAYRTAEREQNTDDVFINRSPDPVMINRIRADRMFEGLSDDRMPRTFVHPGYGLSAMEMQGLSDSFPAFEFNSFLERSRGSKIRKTGKAGRDAGRFRDRAWGGSIISISAGNSSDALSLGLGDEHIQELLVRLMRPLLRGQASLLYAGRMPEQLRPARPWRRPLNFSGALLQLLLTERDFDHDVQEDAMRLYVPVPCHESVTVHQVAQWTDVCSFVRVPAGQSGVDEEELERTPPATLTDGELEYRSDAEKLALKEERERDIAEFELAQRVLAARGLSAMRRKICDDQEPLTCELPDSLPDREDRIQLVKTLAHIIIGGKMSGFTGIMPGVFEEALYALQARKPLFLIPVGGGAAARLAGWLGEFPKPDQMPPELTVDWYDAHSSGFTAVRQALDKLADSGLPVVRPSEALAELRDRISSAKTPDALKDLLNNGLSGSDNVALLKSESSVEICRLVWKGFSKLARRK